VRTLVPFDARDPNSRLGPVLDRDERRDFAAAMLRDVLDAVRAADGDPLVLSTTDLETVQVDAPVRVDDRPLSTAVGDALEVGESRAGDSDVAPATAVVMSDLALATSNALRAAFARPAPGEVAAAPGLGGGTNVLVVRHPAFDPDYHGTSFADHRAAARAVDAPFHAIDSFRLAVDVDGPSDLPEVLLHGSGRSAEWLVDAGFDVDVTDGRARAVRED
jgi:2-phospho-L-lactate guanylyltransferase